MSTQYRSTLTSRSLAYNPLISGLVKQANPQKAVLLALLGSAAAGAGITGAAGMLRKRRIPTSSPDTTDIEVPQKMAFSGAELINAIKSRALGAGKGLMAMQEKSPWMLPTMALGAPLAMVAGSDAAQGLVHGHMKRQQDSELEAAKKDFDDSIKSAGSPEETAKQLAGATEIGHHSYADPKPTPAVNAAKEMAKIELPGSKAVQTGEHNPAHAITATPPAVGSNALHGGLAAGAIGLMGLLAAYSHGAGYNFANSRTQEDLLGKAVKNKDYLKSLRGQTPIDVSLE